MEEEERLVTCLLCGINTADVYLKRHIRFNHIINNDSILDYMLQLHQPARNSISVQTTITWIREQTTISKLVVMRATRRGGGGVVYFGLRASIINFSFERKSKNKNCFIIIAF